MQYNIVCEHSAPEKKIAVSLGLNEKCMLVFLLLNFDVQCSKKPDMSLLDMVGRISLVFFFFFLTKFTLRRTVLRHFYQ